MKTALFLISLILFTGCVHTTLVVNVDPVRNIQIEHDSGLRRGCYKMAGEVKDDKVQASASFEAHDRSASREMAAIATVGATAVGGPAAGAITAAGEAASNYFNNDKDTDQNCKFDK